MNWIYEGIAAAMWQLALMAGFIIIAAASLWSCEYLGINQGYALLGFYASMILLINLFFSWRSSRTIKEISEGVD